MDFYPAWENSRHLATLALAISPPNDVWETSTENPYWSRVPTQIWVELLIGWIKFPTAARPIRSTTQICAVTRRQYGISALVSQTSFGGETVGRVAKCLLFSQTYFYFLLSMYSHLKDILFREAQTRNFKTFQLRSCIDYVYKLVKDLITRHRKCNL